MGILPNITLIPDAFVPQLMRKLQRRVVASRDIPRAGNELKVNLAHSFQFIMVV